MSVQCLISRYPGPGNEKYYLLYPGEPARGCNMKNNKNNLFSASKIKKEKKHVAITTTFTVKVALLTQSSSFPELFVNKATCPWWTGLS